MLGSQLAKFCQDDALLQKYFAGILGAEQVKRALRRKRRNCFYIVNVLKSSAGEDSAPGHWYLLIATDIPGDFQVFDPLGE